MKNKKAKQMIESITGGKYTTLYNLDTGGGAHVALTFWGRGECFNTTVSITADRLQSNLEGANNE